MATFELANIFHLIYFGFCFSADEFLKPSRLYVREILPLIASGAILSASYIANNNNSGYGGLSGSLQAILPPQDFAAEINVNTWSLPSMYGWIHAKSTDKLTPTVLANKFNLGLGLIAVVPRGSTAWKSIDGAVEIGKVFLVWLEKRQKNKNE